MRSALFLGLCVGVLSLSGCAGAFDPYQRPGNWALTGASNETIAQQAADKGDLIQGRSEPGTNGDIAVQGIEKARTGGTEAGLQTTLTATAPGGTSGSD
jgi:hypothetical protein